MTSGLLLSVDPMMGQRRVYCWASPKCKWGLDCTRVGGGSAPGRRMQMPEMTCQETAFLMLSPSTNAIPPVMDNCIKEASAPLIESWDTSTMYTGAVNANAPAAKPKKEKKRLVIL